MNKKKTKVLVVSHSYLVTENQKNITALSDYADVKVIMPHIIPDKIFGKHKARLDDKETYLIYRRLSFPRSQYLLATPNMGMNGFKPDVIHVEYDPWSIIFWQVALYRWLYAKNAKIVCTVKKNTFRTLKVPLQVIKNIIANTFIAKVDHFIAINKGVKTIYSHHFSVDAKDITIMQHLGMDLEAFNPGTQRQLDKKEFSGFIGYCGRLDHDKGIMDLISALVQLNEGAEHPLRLKILGNGDLKGEINEKKLPWIEVLDPIPHSEVVHFMRSLDVYVLPARITPDHEEHDAHALLEALACGVPSIGSHSGIIPEVLEHECGLIFQAEDIQDLVEKLQTMISDCELRQTLSNNAIHAVREKYSLQAIAEQKNRIYERL